MADISSDAAAKPVDPADWKPLLQRFADALSVVIGGLAQIADKPEAAQETGTVSDPGTAAVPLGRAAELATLLQHNDTRAEQVIAEIRGAWPGPQPQWLADAARAIGELDYPRALEMLRAAGALGPS